MKLSNKSCAFTLAEVLITLGIIGVVAAMTMPTLINQTNGAQYKAAYKKALSAISQAVTLNVALEDISFADTVEGTAGSLDAPKDEDNEPTGASIASLLNSRMNVVGHGKPDDTDYSTYAAEIEANNTGNLPPTVNTYLFFNDSSMFAFDGTKEKCTLDKGAVCEGFIDVNGQKGPNKVVTCSTGTTGKDTFNTTTGEKTEVDACTVSSPTDVYPVYFYDQTIIPSTNAGKAVLYGK